MKNSKLTILTAAAGALGTLAMSASAHVPFLEETDYTPEKPYIVHDAENSKSLSARIGKPGDVDVYRIDLEKPARIYTATNIPWCPQYETFGVTYALAGPGLPAPAIPLPVTLPEGYGAVVVRDTSEQTRESWVEPFSGRKMWLGEEYALDAAPAGTYTMIIWNERGQTGDYIAVIGEGEVFNAPEIRQTVATSPKLRDGANLMVKCNPTVAAPQRPNFAKPGSVTSN
ncbi:MAG: hypothetical protein E4H19_13175 [Chromatiales bacterium]|jgi:hypothetical protein|nr:MAG: hypothetical protein E4H19_13175 [Chromatiales bacterium]